MDWIVILLISSIFLNASSLLGQYLEGEGIAIYQFIATIFNVIVLILYC